MKAEQSKTGRYHAGNKSWPAWNRTDFEVKIGYIETLESEAEARELQAKLQEVLNPYGVEVKVEPITVVFMAAEDLAERNAIEDRIRTAGLN